MRRTSVGFNGHDESDYSDEDPPVQTNRDRGRARAYTPPYDEPSRRPAAEREQAFNSVVWLIEGATGLMEELRHNDLGLSEDFWVHAYAARREGLLAMRAALDEMIERTEMETVKEREREKRRERRGGINVDF